ncbi:hypothetical protein BA062_34430 [Prauserella flavalba]|uniref:IclR-ED domain-containing protein n=1 Tax=Prauserella flavalba TaxID=1477506 RepID=A0A318LB85_9PSEU|nr:hypothetical protein BA062_34430 [Prauserella flavalba]
MPVGRDGDHAVAKAWQEQVREGEMPEVVGPELQLEAVSRAGEGRDHNAGVVDQQIDGFGEVLGERPHRGEIGEVELPDVDVAGDRGGGLAALAGIAHGEHHTGPLGGQRSGGGASDPAVSASDADEGFVVQQRDRAWRATMLMWRLGCAVNSAVGISGLAREHADRLREELDETAVYAVLDQDAVTYAVHSEPVKPVRAHVRLGSRHGLLT